MLDIEIPSNSNRSLGRMLRDLSREMRTPPCLVVSRTENFSHARSEDLDRARSEEHTSELQSHSDLVCRLLLEKKKNITKLEPKNRKKQTRKKSLNRPDTTGD